MPFMNTFTRNGNGKYTAKYMQMCNSCKGCGVIINLLSSRETCPVCQGSGRVIITKEIIVTVEPYNL